MKYGYVVWTNTDLTEGRGYEYPLLVCQCESTARRIGKGKYVQGTDCNVTKERIFLYKNIPYGPIRWVIPCQEDLIEEHKLNLAREKKEKVLAVIDKARTLGLTDEEIETLKDNI